MPHLEFRHQGRQHSAFAVSYDHPLLQIHSGKYYNVSLSTKGTYSKELVEVTLNGVAAPVVPLELCPLPSLFRVFPAAFPRREDERVELN
jgi:hypothetical protein